jgi:hypothetical protein
MKAFLTRALVFVFPCVAIAQIASLQIKVLEGEGAAHPAGAHISRPLTVQVTDDMGQPVAGAAVSFQLPPEGPSGLFSNGLRTDLAITDAAGRATIHSIQLNRDSGQFRIRITVVKEQARAGIISFQYISDTRPTPVAPAAPAPPAAPAEPSAERSAGPPAAEPPSAEPAATVARSPGITPTTAKMGSRIGKKWIVLAVVVVVAAGAAAFAVSRAGAKSSSTVSSSVVSISPPTITIGNPNP